MGKIKYADKKTTTKLSVGSQVYLKEGNKVNTDEVFDIEDMRVINHTTLFAVCGHERGTIKLVTRQELIDMWGVK